MLTGYARRLCASPRELKGLNCRNQASLQSFPEPESCRGVDTAQYTFRSRQGCKLRAHHIAWLLRVDCFRQRYLTMQISTCSYACMFIFDYTILVSRFRNLSLNGMLSFSPDFKEQIVYLSEGWPSHAG